MLEWDRQTPFSNYGSRPHEPEKNSVRRSTNDASYTYARFGSRSQAMSISIMVYLFGNQQARL